MSRDFDTRAALLNSAKAEFLEKGFEQASLRAICARAHVTTGAFYSNFEKKDDLFRALIDPMMGAYDSLYERAVALQCATKGDVRSGELAIMDFVMDHRDEFKLLFDCAQGSSYEGCKAALLERFDKTCQESFDERAGEPVDPALVRTVVRMRFQQYVEMIYSDYDREHVLRITELLYVFLRNGSEALMKEMKERPG